MTICIRQLIGLGYLLSFLFAQCAVGAGLELQPFVLERGSDGALTPARLERGGASARDMVAYRARRAPFRQHVWLVARLTDANNALVRGLPAERWDIAFDGVSLRAGGGQVKGRLTVSPIHLGDDGAAVVFVVNRSPSLEGEGMSDSPEARIRNWIQVFGGEWRRDGRGHRFALVAYGRGAVRALSPFVEDPAVPAELSARPFEQDRDPDSGKAADPVAALTEALKALRPLANSPRRGIVLITDGEDIAGVAPARWREFWERRAIETPSDREIVFLAQPVGHRYRGREMIKNEALEAFVKEAQVAGFPAASLGRSDRPTDGCAVAERMLAADHLILFETARRDFPPADATEHRATLTATLDGRAMSSRPATFFTISGGGMPGWQIGLLIGLLALLLAFAGFMVAMMRLRQKPSPVGAAGEAPPPAN